MAQVGHQFVIEPPAAFEQRIVIAAGVVSLGIAIAFVAAILAALAALFVASRIPGTGESR